LREEVRGWILARSSKGCDGAVGEGDGVGHGCGDLTDSGGVASGIRGPVKADITVIARQKGRRSGKRYYSRDEPDDGRLLIDRHDANNSDSV